VGSSRPPDASHDRTRQFVAVILADTEDVWKQVFRSSGKTYNQPKLALYTRSHQLGLRLRQTA
jgi:uncharacterized protein